MTKPESRIFVQIDRKAYAQKPEGKEIGGIKSRTQKSEAQNLTIEKFATEIEQGKSFSPGILEGGLGASNWKEQQIFGVDIDNNGETLPILTPKEAMKICQDNGVLPALCYKTFSDTEVKPKFRFMFKLNEPLKDKSKRLLVASTLVALFPQADKSCVNADRIFFGTNRKVKILDKTISFDKILELSAKQAAPVKELTELDKLKSEFDFENFLNEVCGEITRKTETYIMYKNCPICGHHDDFIYYKKSKTFKCFGAHGGAGGSIIDYLAIDIGLREGELTGLKWEDINFNTCEININKQRHYITGIGNIEGKPKTDAGVRTVTASKTVIAFLKEYKKQQNENRLKFGTAWQNGQYVFLHEDGSPISTQLPYKWFTKFLNRHNLPKITFHQLRHTNASLLISSGEDIVTVSGRLGHADKNVTLNTYSHIIKSKETQVANKMDEFYERLKANC